MNNNKFLMALAALFVCGGSAVAADEVSDSLVNNYMRSSLYTVILTSDRQNTHFENEAKKAEGADGGLMTIAKSIAKTDEKRAANDSTDVSVFALPSIVFPTIEIPNQFNDHNLAVRVLNFDSIRATLTDDDLKAYPPAKKKKAGFGGVMKAMAGMSTDGDNINNDFDNASNAVINKFFNTNHVGEHMIGKWYAYNPEGESRWSPDVVVDRGHYNFTREELNRAATDQAVREKIEATGFNMISNTFVMAVNLRFRSYQAIVAEASAMANAVGSQFGGFGKLAAMGASAGASAAAGDGYTVQAVSSLYRLVWNDDINQQFAVDIYEKNAPIDDLIAKGICKLEYVGTEKSSSNIRQSLFSTKPISDLVKRATARAIDEAIIKLQNSHEEFRTVLPVMGGDGEHIYAAIGTKEGLNEKDEYEILEKQEDKDGKIIYKSVGTVKPVKGQIWNNAYGAEEEVSENEKATEADIAALNLGHSAFKGKKGDYRGYYLRLKKKK